MWLLSYFLITVTKHLAVSASRRRGPCGLTVQGISWWWGEQEEWDRLRPQCSRRNLKMVALALEDGKQTYARSKARA